MLPDFISAIRRYWRGSSAEKFRLRCLHRWRFCNAVLRVSLAFDPANAPTRSILVAQKDASVTLVHVAEILRCIAILRAKYRFDDCQVATQLLIWMTFYLSYLALFEEVRIKQVDRLLVRDLILFHGRLLLRCLPRGQPSSWLVGYILLLRLHKCL